MIPGEVGEARAVRAQAWRGIEIVSAREHPAARVVAVPPHADDRVHRLRGPRRVVLAHAHEPRAPRVGDRIGVAHVRRGGERPRCRTRILPVQPLVRKIRKEHAPVDDAVRGAPVLMHARARVHVARGQVGDGPVRAAAHDDVPPGLLRPGFDPVHRVPVERDRIQPDGPGDDQVGGNRRLPRAVRCGSPGCHRDRLLREGCGATAR